MILARPLRAGVRPARLLPAEIWWEDEELLRPGDRATVTARVIDDHAGDFLDAGQRFTLWSGGEVGHGTVYRRVFTDYGPSRPRPPRRAAPGCRERTARRLRSLVHDTSIA